MKSLIKLWDNRLILCILSILFSINEIIAQAPTVENAWFGKTAFYYQIGDNIPKLDPVHPYVFSSQCSLQSGNLLSANITLNGLSYNYIKTGEKKADIFSLFKSKEDLIACYPSGNYTLNANSSNGSTSIVLQNEEPVFPDPPRVLSGNNTCWINELLVITSDKTNATFSWAISNQQIDDIWISDNNEGKNYPPNTESYILTKNYIDSLPFDTPIYQLIQFNSYLGNAATTFYLYKPSPLVADEDFLLITKMRSFRQASNNSIIDWGSNRETIFFDEYGPFSFSVESSKPKILISPNSFSINTTQSGVNNFRLNSGSIANKNALDQSYPNGNYTTGNQTVKLIGDIYPNNLNPIKILKVNGKMPNWVNGKLVIDSKIQNRIEWTPLYTNTKSKFEIAFAIQYINNFQETLVNFESGSFKDNKRKLSSFLIPSNSLNNKNDYLLSIKYYNYCSDSRARYGTATFIFLSTN